jgi:nitrogen fixation protein FixH
MHTSTRKGIPRWGLVVVGLLCAHVSGMILAVRIATGDPTFTSVPDYYQRAVAWDDQAASQRASDALGWQAELSSSALGDRLVLVVRDAHGAPVDGLVGTVSAYHHARTRDVFEAPLTARGDGTYFAAIAVGAPGAWQVALRAERGGEVFVLATEVVVRDETTSGAAASGSAHS